MSLELGPLFFSKRCQVLPSNMSMPRSVPIHSQPRLSRLVNRVLFEAMVGAVIAGRGVSPSWRRKRSTPSEDVPTQISSPPRNIIDRGL